ncbi:MAG: YcbK family protein [bacterium]
MKEVFLHLGAAVLLFTMLIVVTPPCNAGTHPSSRYFHSGDGSIAITSAKNGESFSGMYRSTDGIYQEEAIKAIHRVFDAPYGTPLSEISLRLVEFLDFLVDSLQPEGKVTIVSGWRSPEYNRKLREKGRLAAKASLHQYGMAADIKVEGLSSERIWKYVKEIGFGGAGYYHGEMVHIDVGPPRTWDERTSGVGTDISDENKLIGLVADQDIYLTGESIRLRFIRMTMFPIGVSPKFVLERVNKEGEEPERIPFRPDFGREVSEPCPEFHDIGEMAGITWRLPNDLPAGQYRIRASFCSKEWERMPRDVATTAFQVSTP